MRSFACIVFAFCLLACSRPDRSVSPDRSAGPEAALESARVALGHRDMDGYFDALTEKAARDIMANSIGICLGKKLPAMRELGYKPSEDCEGILTTYGWPSDGGKTTAAFKVAVARIENPRALAASLETNHRKHGAGTSFVWEYLERLKVADIVVEGVTAKGTADWGDGERKPIIFLRDQTGWRVDPTPWQE